MAAVEGRTLSSGDPCVSIVHGLLRYRKGDENDPFPKKAIESLVRKLKEKRDELDSLISAVTSGGDQITKCVTIPRTLDGRLQVATRKGFPHVVYARIWRWPDVHKNELKHLRFCQYAFDLKRDGICVNPYHYERIVPAGIDLTGLSLHQTGEGYPVTDESYQAYHRSNSGEVLSPNTDDEIQERFPEGAYSLIHQEPCPPLANIAAQHPVMPQHPHAEAAAGSPWVKQPGPSWVEQEMPSLIRQSPIVVEPHVHSGKVLDVPVSHETFQSPAVDIKPVYRPQAPAESVAYLAGTVAATDYWRNVVSSSEVIPAPLSTRPLPDIWCSITYFELDSRVGEIFKVPMSHPIVTVDGYTNPSSPDRFCLGKLTNVQRSETTEKARLHIGKGVQLVLEGEGDVWVRCLSDHSIFVQSYYLDRESGRQPGDAVHKIYPAAFIKVFDLNQCYSQMRQWAAMSHSAAIAHSNDVNACVSSQFDDAPDVGSTTDLSSTMGVGADDLRSLCVIRMSFVKGWGPDYPRPKIKDTPCWIEIQLHRPLQLLDEVLQLLASKQAESHVTGFVL